MRAAIFDFGGVLTTDPLLGVGHYEDALGVERGALMRLLLEADGNGPWQRLERGELSARELWTDLRARARTELGVELTLEGLASSFAGTWRVRQPMVDLVRELRPHIRVVLLTNNVAELGIVWRGMIPVEELFDAVIDSSAVGMRKPDPRIFQLALEAAGARAEESVFIDDSPANVRAAEELGLTAIHFTDEGDAIARVRALTGGVEGLGT
jgi:putative hydrolase of the HAD superfamily